MTSTHYCWNMSRGSRAEAFDWTPNEGSSRMRPYHSALIPGTRGGLVDDRVGTAADRRQRYGRKVPRLEVDYSTASLLESTGSLELRPRAFESLASA